MKAWERNNSQEPHPDTESLASVTIREEKAHALSCHNSFVSLFRTHTIVRHKARIFRVTAGDGNLTRGSMTNPEAPLIITADIFPSLETPSELPLHDLSIVDLVSYPYFDHHPS